MNHNAIEHESWMTRFSFMAYAQKNRITSKQAEYTSIHSLNHIIHVDQSQPQQMELLTKELRDYLVGGGGKSDEEQLAHQALLNRGVLGYFEDRTKLLAIINDQLVKKRIYENGNKHKGFGSLAEAIFAEIIGLSVLELVLKDKEGLEEIQVIGVHIFEVRNGRCLPSSYRFQAVEEVERIQQNLVLFNKDTINPRKKWAEVMLQDGSRVTMTGFGFTAKPTLTIRFFSVKQFNLEQLSDLPYETISTTLLKLLQIIIHSYFNVVLIGPTNSGKTHFMKAMIGEMADEERIVTIESRRELNLSADYPDKNVIEYEADENSTLHSGQQAFKLALRQTPKRICHAEIRDHDANVYVRACTRGHVGSLTSVHANELEDVPDAITDMCLMENRGVNALRLTKRIAEYVTQIGIEMGIVLDKRKVVRVGEMQFTDGVVKIRELVRFDYVKGIWIYPEPFSERAAARIAKHGSHHLDSAKQLGFVI